MNPNPPIQPISGQGNTPWRFYYNLRRYGGSVRAGLRQGPGGGAEVKHRYNISQGNYKKIVAFLADHPGPVGRAIRGNNWSEVEDIIFARWGSGFRRLRSYTYVIELLKSTCREQFRRYNSLTATFEDIEVGTAPAAPAEPAAETRDVEHPLAVALEPAAVPEIPALQPPLPREVQTEWAQTNPELLAVEILEPRLEAPATPANEGADLPNPLDSMTPIPSAPAVSESPTPPTGVSPESAAPPPIPSEVPSPVSTPSLTLEKIERWIRIGLAAEAYLTPAGLRRLLGEEEPKE